MSTLRVFELAREYGIDSKELITRMSSIGINATDHLTTLDSDKVEKVRRLLADSPFADVVERRVTRTVKRRRSRRKPTAEAVPAVEAAAAGASAASSSPAQSAQGLPTPEPQPSMAVVQEVQPPSPGLVELSVADIQDGPTAASESTAPAVDDSASATAPPETATAPESAGPAESAPGEPAPDATAAQPTVASTPEAAAAAQTAPADGAAPEATAAPGPKKPTGPTKPTMERAVVITAHVDRKVAEAVARTRAEKGYDRPAAAADDRAGADRKPGAPRTPETREGDAAAARRGDPKKKAPGRRLVYDKRRDHLRRRGLLEHDDIFRGGRAKKKRPKKGGGGPSIQTQMKAEKRVVKMGSAIQIGEFAQQMMVKSQQVIGKLMALGVMATVNQAIDFETATMLAEDFDWRVESVAFDLSSYLDGADEEAEQARPPVVTVMGHVDHGKTSLLDCIRSTRVAEGEAGGITQHIGAYTVDMADKGTVVFIDTPGHEAFTAMRARGSKATDLVILVVAADDGVMPQTIESINHARAADVPIIVAVNKIDKSNANVDRVLTELSEHGLVAEDWGGETVMCRVSALKNEGIENLLEMVLLQAELMELTASEKVSARGLVLEGRLERGRGPVATLLVQAGVLSVGDTVVSGTVTGKVRAMTNDRGKRVKNATPSMPVEVIGLSGVPEASEPFYKVKDEKAARSIVEHRVDESRTEAQVKTPKMSLDALSALLAKGEVAELNIIVKADVHGSAEALKDALTKLEHPEVSVKVIHTAVGGITESDVNLASASNAIIIGFGVRPEAKAKRLAERESVDLKLYSIIYDALDDVKLAMAGLLSPVEQEKQLGRAEVRATFPVPRVGTIAGSFVTEGQINRGSRIRLVRDSKVVYQGTVTSLRRFKNDVREVQSGYECGIGIGYNDVKEGDVLEAFEIEQIAATLD